MYKYLNIFALYKCHCKSGVSSRLHPSEICHDILMIFICLMAKSVKSPSTCVMVKTWKSKHSGFHGYINPYRMAPPSYKLVYKPN